MRMRRPSHLNRAKLFCVQFWRDLTWNEISGSMGDLGTFLPLVVGLVTAVQLDLGTTLLFTGFYNIITGMLFGIPMPVQPMKTIAAVALAEAGALTLPQIMAAGIFVSSVVFFLGVTGLITIATKLMPSPVIRGMQLGLGLALSQKGFQMVWYANGKSGDINQWWTAEGLFLGLFSIVFILVTIYPGRRSTSSISQTEEDKVLDQSNNTNTPLLLRPLHKLGAKAEDACSNNSNPSMTSSTAIPAALILVVIGIIIVLATHPSVVDSLSFGPSTPSIIIPSAKDWKHGILVAGLPQLALTIFNSVVSVCALANDLFPEKSTSTIKVSTSVGMMNLIGCWFGAMPCCHGCGGLAGQVRFGACTGAAPIFLGLVKISLSLLFGSSLYQLLQYFPSTILGAMLIFSGIELASVARGQTGRRGLAIMLFTAAVVLGVGNVAIGVAAGLIAAYLLMIRDAVVGIVVVIVAGNRKESDQPRAAVSESHQSAV